MKYSCTLNVIDYRNNLLTSSGVQNSPDFSPPCPILHRHTLPLLCLWIIVQQFTVLFWDQTNISNPWHGQTKFYKGYKFTIWFYPGIIVFCPLSYIYCKQSDANSPSAPSFRPDLFQSTEPMSAKSFQCRIVGNDIGLHIAVVSAWGMPAGRTCWMPNSRMSPVTECCL